MNSINTLFDGSLWSGALFEGNLAYAFAWTMVHSLWQSAVVALGLAISMRITRNQSSGLRYVQGLVALAFCVAASVVTFVKYYSDVVAAEAAVQSMAAGEAITYSGGVWEQFYSAFNNNVHWIVLFWLLGFAFQFCRYVLGFAHAQHLKTAGVTELDESWQARLHQLVARVGLKRDVTFKASSRTTSACVIGHFKPVVLVPLSMLTSLSVEQVEVIVLHELAHIRRNDYLVNAAQYLVRVFYFFNPAVLWISARIDVERENACDDAAVAQCGNRKLYASSLAQISEMNLRTQAVMAAKRNSGQTLVRIKRLFTDPSGVSKSMERLTSAVCAGMLILTMNVSAAQLNSLPKEPSAHSPVAAHSAITADLPALSHAPRDTDVASAAPATVSPSEPVQSQQFEPQKNMTLALNASAAVDYAAKKKARQPQQASTAEDSANLQLAQNTASDASASERPSRRDTGRQSQGMELFPSPDFDRFYIASEVRMPVSRNIYVEDVEASFANVWMERFRSVTSESYRSNTLRRYAAGFTEELKQSLEEAGWNVVDSPSDDALRLAPKLFDLYIMAPETPGLEQTIVAQVGQGATELEFFTPGGEPIMKIVDWRSTQTTAGSPFEANRANNYRYFKMLMSDWADSATTYLNNVMAIVDESQRN